MPGGYNRAVDDRRAVTPATIHADRAAGTLAIKWGDEHQTIYDAISLRWLCPCAFCRGEGGQPGWLDAAPRLTPDQTRLTDVRLVGRYALAPQWADGHATGIYTFDVLRQRCPCTECTARRGAAGMAAGHQRKGTGGKP